MKTTLLAINTVLPLFMMMLLGYVLRRLNLLSSATLKEINKLVFLLLIPMLVFQNIYSVNDELLLRFEFVAFSLLSIIVAVVIMTCLLPKIIHDPRQCSAIIQANTRTNVVLFSVPITTALVGVEYAGMASILLAFVLPCTNVLSVIVLERFRGGHVDAKSIVRKIFTHPVIITSVVALIMLMLEIKLPSFLESSISSISGMTTPLALMVLGASFEIENVKRNKRVLFIGILLKLIIIPAIALFAAIVCGFHGAEFAVLLVLCSAPPATSTFPMACEMGSDGELAGQILALATLFWVPICVVMITLFSAMNLFAL